MNKQGISRKLQIVLIIYMLLQPFMEIIYFYRGNLATALPVTIPTLIRLVLVFVMAILLVIYLRKDRGFKFLLIYAGALLIYFALHLYFTKYLPAYSYDGFNYSLSQEINYLIRLTIPVFILITTMYVGLSTNLFIKVVYWINLLFSGTVVISNILKIGVASYQKDQIIKGSIFDWFRINNKIPFNYLASDGFFNFANTISTIIFFLMTLTMYYLIKQPSALGYIVFVANLFASLMIGTRTALYGFVLAMIAVLGLHLLQYWRLGEALNKQVIAAFFVGGAIFMAVYPYSPTVNRVSATDNIVANIDLSKEEEMIDKKLIAQYVKEDNLNRQDLIKKYVEHKINARELYKNVISSSNPTEKYPNLWYNVINWDSEDRVDLRKIEKTNMNLIASQFNPVKQALFGVSYSRMVYFIFNYEHDFIAQYYTIGLLGIILLILPIFVPIVLLGIKALKQKQLLESNYLIYLAATAFFIFGGVYTGNVFDSPTAMSIIAFVFGVKMYQEFIKGRKDGAQE